MRAASSTATTLFLTVVAMLAFAANSLLCRMALGDGLMDPASFTVARVASGAGMLWLVMLARRRGPEGQGSWWSATLLFAYMVFFSFAYVTLAAGTGALLLFAAVQATMFAVAIRGGERFTGRSWAALSVAILGMIWLLLPGVTAPNLAGAVYMSVAGIAWGWYSLRGRTARDPVAVTADNFRYALPYAIAVGIAFMSVRHLSAGGMALAVASGALTSGAGYVIWYAALGGLTAGTAATVQLSVPVIAAIAGAVLLAEPITSRLIVASIATLGGIALVITQRNP